jgi:hypothetical protein
MDENDGVAPGQVLEMGLEVGLGRRGFEMQTTLVESQSRVEGFGVQVSDSRGCATTSDSAFDSASQFMTERTRIGVSMDDEAVLHSLPNFC